MVNELKGGCWLGLECSIVAAERHITEVEIEVDIRDGPVTGSYWRRGRWERGRGGGGEGKPVEKVGGLALSEVMRVGCSGDLNAFPRVENTR